MTINEIISVLDSFAKASPFTALVVAAIILYVRYPNYIAANNERDKVKAQIEKDRAEQERTLIVALDKAFETVNEAIARSAGQDYQFRNLLGDYNNMTERVRLLQTQLDDCTDLANDIEKKMQVSPKRKSASRTRPSIAMDISKG